MKYPQALALLAALPKETLRAIAAVSSHDGHGLYDPVAYIEAGLPMELTAFFTTTHKSDGTPKGAIISKGGIVPQLEGIYGLTVNEAIASALELKVGTFSGRGFRAQATYMAIQHALTEPAAPLAA